MKRTDYVMLHLKASGPCSFESIEHWLRDQVPSVDSTNSRAETLSALNALLLEDAIIRNDDNSYEIKY